MSLQMEVCGTKGTMLVLIYRANSREEEKRVRGIWVGDVSLLSLTQQSCMCKHGRRLVRSLKDFMFCFYDDAYGVM